MSDKIEPGLASREKRQVWFGTFAMLFHATRHVVGHELST